MNHLQPMSAVHKRMVAMSESAGVGSQLALSPGFELWMESKRTVGILLKAVSRVANAVASENAFNGSTADAHIARFQKTGAKDCFAVFEMKDVLVCAIARFAVVVDHAVWIDHLISELSADYVFRPRCP